MEVKANVAFDIKLPVVNLAGTLKVTGTVYVLISKAASNEVWSTDSGGRWVTRATATLPSIEAPVTGGETWFYSVAAAVTNGLADPTRLFIVLTDSTTPGSIAALSPTVEVLVRSDLPAIIGSAVGAAASVTAAVTLAADQAVNVTKWKGTTVPDPATAGYPVVTQKVGTGTGEMQLASGAVRAVDGSGNAIMAAESYTAPPSATTVASEVRTNLTTELGHLDADVGDCSSSSELSAAAQAILTAIGNSGGSGASPSEIADAVLDEVLAGHVTADSLAKVVSDLLFLSGSGGAYATTLQVVDGDGDPIADVKFSLYAGGTLYTTGSMGPSGVRVIGLQAATYSIRLARAGVDFGAPTTFTVTADGETKTFTGSLVTLPVSDDPDYCRISGTLLDAGGNVLADQEIRFRVVVPAAVGAATGVSVWVEVTSDSVGAFTVDLVRETVVQVDCQPAGYNLTEKTVPDAAGQDFQDWA